MAYTDEEIMALVKERGILRYSMLMARFHISSVEAKNIVSDYISKGIVDEDGRYGKKSECSWKRFSPKTIAEINSESETQEEAVKEAPRKRKKPRIQKPRTQKSVRIQMDSCHFSDQNSLRAVFFVPDFDLSFFLYHLEKMKEEKT